ncbi:type II toxin-antitoxin system Phd/YefM family antitoxin [Sphaerotilus sp.]|jgi:prevent-host-death family protein|uniref:type II toxin-antitoxin system Phd/YefM family antitoxin n=1 Tax=Sphaerotilus sp. TaxID=2093942 RepID=UPI0025D2934A|nr:type II toxin-antitoxin system prevent-host-death family antitoxin [Sphaerotilus sp.]
MKVFTFSEARQQFSAVLDCAQTEGSVRVTRRDGRVFVIQPLDSTLAAASSPLDVDGVDLGVRGDELVEFIREGRRQ